MIQHVVNQRLTTRDVFDFAPGTTPLHISASEGHIDVAEVLLEHGAVVDVMDEAYDAPLHNAVKSGHDRVLVILLNHGAYPTRAHGQGFAPLMAAIEKGNLSMVKALVNAGADLNIKTIDGQSLLNMAAEAGAPDIVDYLLEKGDYEDLYAKDKSGYAPLDDMILKHDMLNYALILIDAERLVELVEVELNKGRLSLIIELNREKSVPMLKALLQRLPEDTVKKMVNHYPGRFVSPLCTAVTRDILPAIDVLVELGADVNQEGSAEGTPLMMACLRGRLESVKLLVGHGASLTYHRGGKIRSAIDMAHHFPDIQEWLLSGQFAEQKRTIRSDSPPAWRCDGGNCKTYHRRDTFESHLRKAHKFDDAKVLELLETCGLPKTATPGKSALGLAEQSGSTSWRASLTH